MTIQPEQLTLFPLDIRDHASPLVMPGSERARKMTVTSGQKLAGFLKRSDPLGSLVRTLLVTSHWGSTKCLMTWTLSVTPRKRLLYRLQLSAPPTGETEYSLWLPTPNARDGKGFYAISLNQALKRVKDGRQLHWMHTAILYHGWNKALANPRFSEAMMGFPIGWTEV